MKVELTIRYDDGTDVFVEDWGDCHELLRLLAEAGVLEVEKRRDWCFGGPGFADESYVDVIRYFSPWKEAK